MSTVTAVLDVGKTHSKLLLLDPRGSLVGSWRTAGRARPSAHGFDALDCAATQDWLKDTLAGLGSERGRIADIIVTTHGAAIAGLTGEQLGLPVPDYEFPGFDQRAEDWNTQLDGFDQTLSPLLARGLNIASQLDWLERHCPAAFARIDTWLPYPQYWAWWLSGVKATEVSSLGCHTQLWRPREGNYSSLARRRGWAQRFAPLRRAWEVLGTLRPQLALELGLPAGLRVHCGVHDSNACLARYLRSWPRMTLVSTGTWIVVMAPGTPAPLLEPQRDFMANVSVRGECVPTGRFMGGREIETLCAGAEPGLASLATLTALLQAGIQVLPGFGALGGPFGGHAGALLRQGQAIPVGEIAQHFSAVERATLAALHAAYCTAWVIERMGAFGPIAVDGPLAVNPVYCGLLAAVMPAGSVCASTDPVEGTARGSWVLTRWTEAESLPPLAVEVDGSALGTLVRVHHGDWRRLVSAAD